MDWRYVLFGLDGRINRAKFWAGIGILFISAVVIGIAFRVAIELFVGIFFIPDKVARRSVTAPLAFLITFCIPLYSGLVLQLKRSNDRGWPQWPVLLVNGLSLLSVILQAVAILAWSPTILILARSLGLLLFLPGIWLTIDLGFLGGTQGPNRYGRDPLGRPTEPGYIGQPSN